MQLPRLRVKNVVATPPVGDTGEDAEDSSRGHVVKRKSDNSFL